MQGLSGNLLKGPGGAIPDLSKPKQLNVRDIMLPGHNYEFHLLGHEEIITGELVDTVSHVAVVAYQGGLGETMVPIYHVVRTPQDVAEETCRHILASQVSWFRCLNPPSKEESK